MVPGKSDSSSLYVLEREEGVLFTADAFGAFYASEQVLVSQIAEKEAYFDGVKRYYRDIFGKKREKSMEAAVELVHNHKVELICPACGPVADCDLERLVSAFVPESEEAGKKKPALAVIYAPGNYVRELAFSMKAGVEDSGEIAVEMYDLSAVNRDEILEKAASCDAYLFGTSQVQGEAAKAVWDILTSLQREECEGKPAAVFASVNSQGSAAGNLRKRLDMLGFDLSLQDWILQGKPDHQALKNAFEYGYNVGCCIQKIPNLRKPTLVKCLVCGEIFDASLGSCPVCGVGLEQCVPMDTEDVGFQNNTLDRYVILGGGIAAVSAAEAIRKRDETGKIVMLSAESDLPINRPMLTKDLEAAALVSPTLFIHDQGWYEERRIELRLGCRVTALNAEEKKVTTASGEIISYDKLIYAMGAECFVPPFEGHDKEGVLTIRHLSDSSMLQDMMRTAKNAVIIGGGVLGLEAANELMRCGLAVTVLEAAPQIIGRQMDASSAQVLKQKMKSMHVACYEGVSIAGIEGNERVTGVRLADGREFPADFVIISCGNRGNVQVAKAAGILTERSIVVNERMETSAPDVYACGDCAQFDNINFQLWQEASEQGRVAGANAAGERTAYANQLLGLNLEGFGTSLYAIGDAGKRTEIPYKTVETRDGVTGRQEKYWFYGGSLQGAVLIGAPAKVTEIAQAVTKHARYDEIF